MFNDRLDTIITQGVALESTKSAGFKKAVEIINSNYGITVTEEKVRARYYNVLCRTRSGKSKKQKTNFSTKVYLVAKDLVKDMTIADRQQLVTEINDSILAQARK